MVLVTNGLINSSPLSELVPHISAANVDLKTFDESTYKKLGGDLRTVQNTLKTLIGSGVHIEITHLLVTGINDNLAEFEEMCAWISKTLGELIPLHISRYFPVYKWTKPPDEHDIAQKS